MANMNAKHIFLTGEKQVGKSTLVRRLTALFHGRLAGFRTVRTDGVIPGQFTVHMLRPDETDRPCEENCLFVCRSQCPDKAERFDELGCSMLERAGEAGLIVMDELGPNEADARAFQRAVWDTLDGDAPVLGVLQKADSAFLQAVAAREDVCVVEVTRENRDALWHMLAARRPFSRADA